MPFDQITTKSLALSSVTSDTILNNTIKYEDLSSDVSSAIRSTFATVSSLSANWGSGGSSTPVVTVADPLKFNFTGNGTTTNFTVSGTNDSTNASYIEVFVANVRQEPTFSYTLSANIVKFTEAPPNGSSIVIITPNTKLYNTTTNQYSIPYFGGSGAGIISKTYAELKALRESSSLVPGQYYKITNFQTIWRNQVRYASPASINLTSPVIEPLNILAISTNKFAVIAYSDLYPQDIIYYDFEATWNYGMMYAAGIPNFKGWITRRIDTSKNIDVALDWRHITVNCCRPDLSSIPEWSSTETYNLWNVVKINNKLYYSIQNNNNNNNPIINPTYVNIPSIYWRPITGFREGLTYFPTDENYGIYAFKPDGTYLINLPADLSTRIQKYMFGENAESGNTENILNNYNNILIQGGYSNIFCGGGGSLKFGSHCYFNLLDYSFANTAGDYFYNNILGYSSGNKFGDDFSHNRSTRDATHPVFVFTGNVFIAGTSHNIFLGGTAYNIFDINTTYNHFGNGFRNNKAGSNFYSNFFPHYQTINNIFAAQFYSNFIDSNSSFYGNVTLGQCNRNNFASGGIGVNLLGENFTLNNIGTAFYNNKIGSTFNTNNIGDNFSGNTIGNYTTYNNIGAYFVANSIGTGFSNNTIGSNFNQNNIEDGFDFTIIGNNFTLNNVKRSILTNFNLTASTHVYNSYDKTIFRNSAGQPRLSYYNSSDVQIITSPTA